MHKVTVLIGGHSRGNVSVVRDLGKSAGLLPELSFNSRFFGGPRTRAMRDSAVLPHRALSVKMPYCPKIPIASG